MAAALGCTAAVVAATGGAVFCTWPWGFAFFVCPNAFALPRFFAGVVGFTAGLMGIGGAVPGFRTCPRAFAFFAWPNALP